MVHAEATALGLRHVDIGVHADAAHNGPNCVGYIGVGWHEPLNTQQARNRWVIQRCRCAESDDRHCERDRHIDDAFAPIERRRN